MDSLIHKYARKLVSQGLADEGEPLIGQVDADVEWNREAPEIGALTGVMGSLNMLSILFSRPAEPYGSIIDVLAERALLSGSVLRPEDSESRTFLHEIPVIDSFSEKALVEALKKRKTVIVRGKGVVAYGTVSPEQAFVLFSSVCFSSYVKFFADYYFNRDEKAAGLVEKAVGSYGGFIGSVDYSPKARGPYGSVGEVVSAIDEAGSLTVRSRMVDSFFGNVSSIFGDTIFISQTGSSLDELAGHIDPCPLDGRSTAPITASSELSAHRAIYSTTGEKTVLHGHPKFSVIMSMLCDEADCRNRGRCHVKCEKKRFINDVPIVPGEVGTGPTGLCNTMPPAIKGNRGAIVYGHGLFTTGRMDFTDAFSNLTGIERMCLEEYISAAGI